MLYPRVADRYFSFRFYSKMPILVGDVKLLITCLGNFFFIPESDVNFQRQKYRT